MCLAGTKSGKVMLRPILEIGTEGVLAQVLVLVLAWPPPRGGPHGAQQAGVAIGEASLL